MGRVIESSGNYYEGKVVKSVYQGKGKLVEFQSGAYWEGIFISGFINGKGTEKIPDQYTYTGDFADGKKNGFGEVGYVDGSTYKGAFFDDTMNGYGKAKLALSDKRCVYKEKRICLRGKLQAEHEAWTRNHDLS